MEFKETLEGYNERLQWMFAEDSIKILDQAIVDECHVKVRGLEKVTPTLLGVCRAYHKDQISLGM